MDSPFPTLPIRKSGDGDILEYSIYPVYPNGNLKNVLDYTLDLMSTLTMNYIWNLDTFTIGLDIPSGRLHGEMHLGEESGVSLDEWLVTYVLWKASKRFPNVFLRSSLKMCRADNSIQDSEGEYLLIETALHIPDWLKPETAESRVWIHDGQLKVIPLEEFTAHDPPPLPLEDALKHVRSAIRSEGTTAALFSDPKINAAIQEKIKDIPKEVQDQGHLARVLIPRLLAQVIHSDPQLISGAIQLFYAKTKQLKTIREFKYFVPEDFVPVNVQFSRPLFALIKSQRFNPPPAFPVFNMSAAEREMYSLGIKLTCAFEMLAISSSSRSQQVIDLWNAEKARKQNDAVIKEWTENLEEPSSEEWMILSAEDVQKIRAEDKNEEDQIREMIENMKKFMEGESGFEGIDDEYVSSIHLSDLRFGDFDSDDEDDLEEGEELPEDFDEEEFDEELL